MKFLSKSIWVMLTVDIITFLVSTTFWYDKFSMPEEFLHLTVFITVLAGLAVLFLKDNYKIREFNVNLKNHYLLFEGIVFSQIPAAILLLTFADNVNSLEFVLANLVTIFLVLQVYRTKKL